MTNTRVEDPFEPILVNVKARPGRAKSRTRNRLREHGPKLLWTGISSSVESLKGRPGSHFTSVDGKWHGWFPSDEIEVSPCL